MFCLHKICIKKTEKQTNLGNGESYFNVTLEINFAFINSCTSGLEQVLMFSMKHCNSTHKSTWYREIVLGENW